MADKGEDSERHRHDTGAEARNRRSALYRPSPALLFLVDRQGGACPPSPRVRARSRRSECTLSGTLAGSAVFFSADALAPTAAKPYSRRHDAYRIAEVQMVLLAVSPTP
jgi:hypothetical protein